MAAKLRSVHAVCDWHLRSDCRDQLCCARPLPIEFVNQALHGGYGALQIKYVGPFDGHQQAPDKSLRYIFYVLQIHVTGQPNLERAAEYHRLHGESGICRESVVAANAKDGPRPQADARDSVRLIKHTR